MHVIEQIRAGVVVLEPRAAITAETEADLQDAVERHFSAGRVNLLLDLSHVSYIDSCGLGRIVQTYVSAQRLGGSLKLMNVSGRNRQLLTVTRVLSVLEIHQPSEHAVGA